VNLRFSGTTVGVALRGHPCVEFARVEFNARAATEGRPYK